MEAGHGTGALIGYDQVKAVIDALRAEGARPTIERIWDALDKAGSKGTVHRLAKQYFAELDGTAGQPESLRQLPPDVQQIILSFADQAAATARAKIADELLECRQEAAGLASDNERLSGERDDLAARLEKAESGKAMADGMAAQLARELDAARREIGFERAAAEQVRTVLARAELRLEAVGPLDDQLRQARAERDAQHEARVGAEQSAAVLGARQEEYEERVQELKGLAANLRDAVARQEMRNGELGEALENERQARAVAEKELAVILAVQAERPGTGRKSKRVPDRQGALWQGEREVQGDS